MNHSSGECRPLSAPNFTAKQGQYLAFIYAYTQVMGRPPAEADLQRHFRVTQWARAVPSGTFVNRLGL